jgi:hypothetical protein
MPHEDISENNIIITNLTAEGKPEGILIDMDLGKELNYVPSGASHWTPCSSCRSRCFKAKAIHTGTI